MKIKIIELRNQGKTYNEISKITGLSKATISYHCKKNNLDGRIDGKGLKNKDIYLINCFYLTHTIKETSVEFNIGIGSLKKILNNKLDPNRKIKTNYENLKSFRYRNKMKAIEYMGGNCCVCGYNKCNSALDFHHLDASKKDFSISANMNMSWEKVRKELDKCIMVCSNCHREIHEKLNWQVSTLSDTQE